MLWPSGGRSPEGFALHRIANRPLTARCRRARRSQDDLLHAPVRAFRDIDFVLGRTGERVGAGELLEIASRTADHAQYLAV